MKKRRVPPVSINKIKRTSGWWEPRLSWFIPSGTEMYDRLNYILLCPICYMVYDSYRQPLSHCENCGTKLYLYRGPIYGKLEISNKDFVIQMITNQVIDFYIIPNDNYVTPVKIAVIMQNAWPALINNMEGGIYEGFYLASPRVNALSIHKPPTINLLNPFQASFYERFALVQKQLELEEMEKKKYQNKGYEVPLTFTDLYEKDVYSMKEKDLTLFLETLSLDYNKYLKERDHLMLSGIRREIR